MRLRFALAAAAITLSTASLNAQQRFTIEGFGGIGYTQMDIDKWAGSTALDWSQFFHQYGARFFFTRLSRFTVGVEVAYQEYAWYQVNFGTSNLEYWPGATHLAGVLRIPVGKLVADVGAGAYMFDGGTDIGAHGAIGYRFALAPAIGLLVQARADIIPDPDAMLLPVGITASLSYGF